MEIDKLQRAQLIINQFRTQVHELQERLIAEQVAHTITKLALESAINDTEQNE